MITGKGIFKKFENKIALDKISFQIDDGCIYGLVGSNGSGKSTLLRLISGVYRADGGEICVDGIPAFDNPLIKSQIAFLGDTPYFLPQSNLSDMARFYASLYPDFSYEEYNRLLSIFPLNPKARLSTFSKGMQRQASLILLLSTKPRYILLDEAFDGLDVVMRKVLGNILMDGVEKSGITAIIASHNLRELESLCDHIGLIHEGKMIMDGAIEGIRDKIHKIQVAFSNVPETKIFEKLDLIKLERTGSLVQIIARGDRKEILDYINGLCPLFAECIEPTLEEMFMYELEVTGYDVKNILE